MLKENIRNYIIALYQQGKTKKEISRLLKINIKTVRKILKTPDVKSLESRKDKIKIDKDELEKLYAYCNGYIQRMYEILTEKDNKQIGYSTLTRLIREYGIGVQNVNQSCHVPDVPGEEMQHDTTMYRIKIGSEKVRVICSGLYFRYSKIRYIKFYPRFNRFAMKCFMDEALRYWKHTAKTCIIDNTNLAVLYGTGANAVIHPEMTMFAKRYGFIWKAHAIGHANRKAGKERNFWTVETNFLTGRDFMSLEDMNKQGFDWGTQRFAHRPLSKTRLIPVQLFEHEKPFLIKLPDFIMPPIKEHKRSIDEYGNIAFDANYYWLPKKSRGIVKVIEYADKIEVYQKNVILATYQKAKWGDRNKRFVPDGVNIIPNQPRSRKKPYHEEEKRLRIISQACGLYIDLIKSRNFKIPQKPRFIRELYMLSKKMSHALFVSVIERALAYRVDSLKTIENISAQLINNDQHKIKEVISDDEYINRDKYQQGRFSDENDISLYKDLLQNDNTNERDQNESKS